MSAVDAAVLDARVALLVAGFAVAAAADLRTREVTDRLWQGMGVVALALGAVGFAGDGVVPVLAWTVAGLFVLEHMFAWDESLGGTVERHANAIEFGGYAVVLGGVAVAAERFGVGESGVPIEVIAVVATVVFARILFEFGVLYGAADAKALMIAGLALPLFATPVLPLPYAATQGLRVLPFALTVLMDAAVGSIVVPIALAVRNARRHEMRGLRGFTGYSIPTEELPERFVWLRDPKVASAPDDDAETADEDRTGREAAARELAVNGVRRVWVTPQLPFVVFLAAGVVVGLLAGNLVLDALAAL